MKSFCDLQRLAFATAEAGNDRVVRPAEQRKEHRIPRGLLFQKPVNDQIVVADDRLDMPDRGAEFGDVALAPLEAERVFDAAFHLHHFEQRMVEQLFNLSAEEVVQIPELIMLHQVRVVRRDQEIRVVLQEKVRDVVQMDNPVERRGTQPVFEAKFVTEQARGLVHIVHQHRVLRRNLRDMVVNDRPVLLVEAGFESEVGDPGGLLARLALLPEIVVIRLEVHGIAEKFLGEPLQQHAGQQPVEVALVGDDHIRPG